ncbi:hypothetical protein ACIQZD_22150 [Peribacillus sp. NPDC096447]|uniref:hypothetical protein n=1 Tax=Peribacillus sp. NPDC096447 TaxID=3364394 RepID=UPI00382333C8
MEKFLSCKSNLEFLEQEERRIAILKSKQFEEMEEWALSFYTIEKRLELIKHYQGINNDWVVKDITLIHEKWDKKLTSDDIMKIANYDINIRNYSQDKYKKSIVNNIHSVFFGRNSDE